MKSLAAVAFSALALGWQSDAQLPLPRGEVAGAAYRGGIAVVGGFLGDGSSSARVDLYRPGKGWSRLPDLPVAMNHAMAAAADGRLYVVGGFGAAGPLRSAFVLVDGRWRTLPSLPTARGAGGAAVVGNVLYVVGGRGPAGLARTTFAYPLRGGRWSARPGPAPREHLGVTALAGSVYAVGGRTAGFDTNLDLVESWRPGAASWRRLPALPEPRGGTGVAAAAGRLVSAGGEAPPGTVATVYSYEPGAVAWTRLPDLPTPRHGLAVVALGGTVHVVGGGTQPGLSVSGAHESLTVRP